MKNLSCTEAELKKSVAYEKKSVAYEKKACSVFTCRLFGTGLLHGKAVLKYYSKSIDFFDALLFSEHVFGKSNRNKNKTVVQI